MQTQFKTLCRETTLYAAWNTIKQKRAVGGIDGVTIEDFNKEKGSQIKLLKEELTNGVWKPQPYLQVAIPQSKKLRMNYSVFECMLTDAQYQSLYARLTKIVVNKEDWINIYPLCRECYARIQYIPNLKTKSPVKIAVV